MHLFISLEDLDILVKALEYLEGPALRLTPMELNCRPYKLRAWPSRMAQAFNPSTQAAEVGGSLNSRPAGLHSEFQYSKNYMERPHLKRTRKIKKNKLRIAFNVNPSFTNEHFLTTALKPQKSHVVSLLLRSC